MSKPSPLPLIVFLILLAAGIAQPLIALPKLPDTVASHFGADGTPNDWMHKNTFTTIILATYLVACLPMLAIAFLGPRTPKALINLPYKDYWLAPERKEETFRYLAHWFLWFGSCVMLLLIAMMHFTLRVNLGQSRKLEHPWSLLICFLAAVSILTFHLIVRFRKPT